MKLALIAEQYPPTDGGVATSAQRVARALSRAGVEVQVLCFDHSRPVEVDDYVVEERDENVRVSRIGPFFLKQKRSPEAALTEKSKSILRRRAFNQMVRVVERDTQAILSFYLLNAGFMAQFVAHELGLPHVACVRGNDIGRNIFNVERFAVIQWVLTQADHVCCVNDHLRRRTLLAFPHVAGRISVITNSASPTGNNISIGDGRERVAAACGWNDDDLRIVFLGTLREKKGCHALLQAMETLHAVRKARLLVIGPEISGIDRRISGPYWDRLVEKRALFSTGWIDRPEVFGWLSGCDVVVMPSLDDGMANGLLEGMTLGLCPLVTDIFKDVVVSGESGLIVPPNDPEAIIRAVEELDLDRPRMRRLGRQARLDMAQRTPDEEARAYQTLIESLFQDTSVRGASNPVAASSRSI